MIEFHWHWGPFAVLIIGKVWCVDIGRVGLYGIGWRVRPRRVRP